MDEDELQSFEANLRGLEPLPLLDAEASESQLLYQCGWEAALAQVNLVPRAATVWRPFAAGAVAGLAAALLIAFTFMIPSSSTEVDGNLLAESPVEDVPHIVREETAEAQTLVANADAPEEARQLLSYIFAWKQDALSIERRSPRILQDTFASESLSQVSRRTWSDVLTDSDVPPGIAVSQPALRFPTLGEMLRDFTNSKDIL